MEDAELRLELVDLGPENIGLELQDTEAQCNREPEPFLEQEELRDTGRRAPEAA